MISQYCRYWLVCTICIHDVAGHSTSLISYWFNETQFHVWHVLIRQKAQCEYQCRINRYLLILFGVIGIMWSVDWQIFVNIRLLRLTISNQLWYIVHWYCIAISIDCTQIYKSELTKEIFIFTGTGTHITLFLAPIRNSFTIHFCRLQQW